MSYQPGGIVPKVSVSSVQLYRPLRRWEVVFDWFFVVGAALLIAARPIFDLQPTWATVGNAAIGALWAAELWRHYRFRRLLRRLRQEDQ